MKKKNEKKKMKKKKSDRVRGETLSASDYGEDRG